MGEVTISIEEYRELLEKKARIDVFASFVRASQYDDIECKECARILGFKLKGGKNDGISG